MKKIKNVAMLDPETIQRIRAKLSQSEYMSTQEFAEIFGASVSQPQIETPMTNEPMDYAQRLQAHQNRFAQIVNQHNNMQEQFKNRAIDDGYTK